MHDRVRQLAEPEPEGWTRFFGPWIGGSVKIHMGIVKVANAFLMPWQYRAA
jgi:hypothetical protein